MTTSHVTLAGFAVALAAGGFAFGSRVLAPKPSPAPAQERQYSDPAEVRAKLERIGRALVLYRQDYPAKPVSEWRNYKDAGVPMVPTILLEEGHPWTVSADDLHYDPPFILQGQRAGTEFVLFYFSQVAQDPANWKRNGTRQILMFDPKAKGMFPPPGGPQTRRTLALRWDGTVDEVELESTGSPAESMELWDK